MSVPPVIRRCFLVAVALASSTLLMRAQISSALVMRGDEFSARAEITRATVYYRRALWLDGRNGVAIDRLAFDAVMSHRPSRIREALRVMSRYLAVAPNDPAVLMDRAMAYEVLGAYAEAEQDFAHLGQRTSDPRAYTFAGFAAFHEAQYRGARKWWNRALQVDPKFVPAQRALARVL